MTTREAICRELRRRRYPQTADMLREKIGKTTVPLICRILGFDDQIVERKYYGRFWYAAYESQFTGRPYRIESKVRCGRGYQWKVERFLRRELAAKQEGAWFASLNPDVSYRLVCGDHVLKEWNTPELQSWQKAKVVVSALRTHLRAPP